MDFIPGICAGIAQTIVGHPFDTIKTRIQNNQPWRNLGVYGYYRGALPIFIGSGILNGIVFPTQQYLTQSRNLPTWIAGGITGFCVTPIIFGFENMKVLRQTHKPISREIMFKSNGYPATMLRETSAFSIYFSSYEYGNQCNLNSFMAGSISGIVSWALTYPIDVIRTRQVAQSISFYQALQQKALYKGIGFVILRSGIVNGCVFTTYEYLKQRL